MAGGLVRIGIFYHADPIGHIPSGIDSFIRNLLRCAPDDLEYTLFGATSDPLDRPVGREVPVRIGRWSRFVPLVEAVPSGSRLWIPLTVRYGLALRRYLRRRSYLGHLDVLDFHRVETLALFRADARPKNLLLHSNSQDIRHAQSDSVWRHAPWLYESLEAALLREADHVDCVSQTAVDWYRRAHPALAERIAFLPTCVDTSVFRPIRADEERSRHRLRVARRFGAPSRLIAWVGRVDWGKNPLLLVDAMRQVVDTAPGTHLLVVGDGNLRPALDARIRSLRLGGHVTLMGALPAERIAELLQAADLFVLSSAYEGMPIAVLEALATGVPVVTTDVGEVRRVVEDGVNGVVVREQTPTELARGMLEALERVDSMRGGPCERSAAPYDGERVLSAIYERHRAQGAQRHRAQGGPANR